MEMKRSSKQGTLLLWGAALAALLSQNLVSAVNFGDQKNLYWPYPGSPPPSGGGHATPTPSHGTPSHSGGSSGLTPSHGTPSQGGGGYRGTPPANCGNDPSGGHRSPTPSTPRPATPTPIVVSPPTPPTTNPSPPYPFDPNSPPFTCTYWRNHPTLIWGLVGWVGTVGNAFGVAGGHGFGANTNLLQALSNTRTDGYGELYREGTAALLNSMAHMQFPYTTTQVRDSFVAALGSDKAAAAQAQLYKMANEGRTVPRA